MKLLDFLDETHIITDLGQCDKILALSRLAEQASTVIMEVEKEAVMKVIMEREELGSTGIGGGVAIPHGKMPEIERMTIFIGRSKEGVDFDAIDNAPVNIIFLLLAPDNSATIYLKVLARVSRMLKKEGTIERMLNVKTNREMLTLIDEIDSLAP